jgi:hypothetical protein
MVAAAAAAGQSVKRTISQYTTFESLTLSGRPGMQYLAM